MKDKSQDLSLVARPQWLYFGALLRDRRNAAKLSRLTLSQRAQLSDSTIKFIENARHPPRRATLIRLLSVAELHLTWADVPGSHKPPAQRQDVLALSPPPAAEEPKPDPARFLMSLIGFDEICLPPGAPKGLRVFQERPRGDGQADGPRPQDDPEDE